MAQLRFSFRKELAFISVFIPPLAARGKLKHEAILSLNVRIIVMDPDQSLVGPISSA